MIRDYKTSFIVCILHINYIFKRVCRKYKTYQFLLGE